MLPVHINLQAESNRVLILASSGDIITAAKNTQARQAPRGDLTQVLQPWKHP